MNDMDRLIDKCDDEFTRALLQEGRRPLQDAQRTARVLTAVGVGGLVLGKASWAAASSWKQMALAAVVSVGGGVTAYQLIHETEKPVARAVTIAPVSRLTSPSPVTDPALPKALEPKTAAVKDVPAQQHAVGEAAEPATVAGPEGLASDVQSGAVQAGITQSAGSQSTGSQSAEAVKNAARGAGRGARGSTLGLEVALLDRARSLLQQGDAPRALVVLDRYRAEYPNGTLSLEAELVRIPALARMGRRKEASDRASRLLARKPNSVVAEQLRAYVMP